MQLILNEQHALAGFRRALRGEDRCTLGELFGAARTHVAAAAYASHTLPFQVMLLAMLLEEHKRVTRSCQALGLPRRLRRLRVDSWNPASSDGQPFCAPDDTQPRRIG